VENCHRGEGTLSLLALSDSRFLSYSGEDSSVKVWRLSTRRKESLLEIDEQFWCCDYEISFRQQLPKFVSVNGNRIVVTYAQEFIAFVLLSLPRTQAASPSRECIVWKKRKDKWWQ
jgi:WD40 repeat protein